MIAFVVARAQGDAKGRVTFNVSSSLLSSPKYVNVPVDELPGVITSNVSKEHSGFTIKEARWDWSSTVVPNNIFIYEVVITDGKKDDILLYSKDGKFLKKGVKRTEENTN